MTGRATTFVFYASPLLDFFFEFSEPFYDPFSTTEFWTAPWFFGNIYAHSHWIEACHFAPTHHKEHPRIFPGFFWVFSEGENPTYSGRSVTDSVLGMFEVVICWFCILTYETRFGTCRYSFRSFRRDGRGCNFSGIFWAYLAGENRAFLDCNFGTACILVLVCLFVYIGDILYSDRGGLFFWARALFGLRFSDRGGCCCVLLTFDYPLGLLECFLC